MCVIIHKPAGIHSIDRSVLSDCYAHNPDGFGLTYKHPASGKLIVKRGVVSKRKLIATVDKHIERSEGAEMLLHFRYATHGVVDSHNCHPFRGNLATFDDELDSDVDTLIPSGGEAFTLVHNGMIGDLCIRHPEWSDTRELVATISEFCASRFEVNEVLESFSRNNRFAILYNCGQVVRYGKWNTEDGLHFSNLNWQWRARYTRNEVAWNNRMGFDWPTFYDPSAF